jgi:DNA-binding transcriptional regulator YiaG
LIKYQKKYNKMNTSIVTPKWIKDRLKEKGLEQNHLARYLEVSKSQVSQWMTGTRNPSKAAKAAIYMFFERKE